ncbi:hypothetical protein JOE63_003064 [Cellulosimicrobium cellulans]|uniref:GmrSD restriction endonuclease domain-containing protein n=1 Tax=Cellulosimicrobium cellulans TaxID=1710 RepID=UPI001957CD66|nr:DUF262 domain-containing protein [Cellulosimicrobium cellulans]MBM7820587.1 hypothetical protein [Cellulosimicrobium cellulans]
MAELDSQPKSIQSLYAWYAEGQLWVNRRYQRKLVWTLEEKQRLVESVLKKYPIPAVLLAERDGGGYEVIDGLQRIHSLMSFIEMQFSTLDGRYFNLPEFPTANTRASEGVFEQKTDVALLSSREVGTFLDYNLAISVMRGATTSEIDDVFGRINTYGHRLSDQERRQAGVQNEFSGLVRDLACEIRGDVSSPELGLVDMPTISIDLPKSKHGYEVSASEVFWVRNGVLRSTDLRDSMDEQCIADIVASVVGGSLVERSKDALDAIYADGVEADRIESALQAYGSAKVTAEFKFVVDEVQSIVNSGQGNLRDLLFQRRTTNAFPALFAVVFLALHELLIGENTKVADYRGVKEALHNLNQHVDTSRGSTSPEDRRKNVNIIKGLVRPHLVSGDHTDIYGDHTSFDIDEAIRRSEIEAPHYELKQGLLRLDEAKTLDPGVLERLLETICAIANNGRFRSGTVFFGVADKLADAERVQALYQIEPRAVGRRRVVGIRRETEVLGENVEAYVQRIRNAIANSQLSEPLKGSVLSSLAYSDYYGLGVLVVRIPEQSDVSTLGDKVFVREGDQTVEVAGLDLLNVQKRFM